MTKYLLLKHYRGTPEGPVAEPASALPGWPHPIRLKSVAGFARLENGRTFNRGSGGGASPG